jgi:hypothetical protein
VAISLVLASSLAAVATMPAGAISAQGGDGDRQHAANIEERRQAFQVLLRLRGTM